MYVGEIFGKGRRGVAECVAVNTCACGGPKEDEGEECKVSLRPHAFFSWCELVNDSNWAEWRRFKTRGSRRSVAAPGAQGRLVTVRQPLEKEELGWCSSTRGCSTRATDDR